jgi:hypothetical protein
LQDRKEKLAAAEKQKQSGDFTSQSAQFVQNDYNILSQ